MGKFCIANFVTVITQPGWPFDADQKIGVSRKNIALQGRLINNPVTGAHRLNRVLIAVVTL